MKGETKVLFGLGLLTIIVFVGAALLLGKTSSSNNSNQSPKADASLLVRKNSHMTASESAKVTVVEFGDYQCPACKAAYPITKEMLRDYGSKVDFVFRNFPLSQHQNAQIAAEAAEAAGAQGKFWEMHDRLYETQDIWAESSTPLDIFIKYAGELGLNTDKFKSDVEKNAYSSIINSDQNDGLGLGINSTPTFFVNGKKIEGVPAYSDLKAPIDSALSSK